MSLQSDTRGQVQALACSGHAGLTVEEGEADLLCAGVSALCGALALGLTQVVRAPIFLQEDYGLFYLRLEPMEEGLGAKAQVLMATASLALRELALHNQGFLEVQEVDSRHFPSWEELLERAEGA